jgi:hypothetical protein
MPVPDSPYISVAVSRSVFVTRNKKTAILYLRVFDERSSSEKLISNIDGKLYDLTTGLIIFSFGMNLTEGDTIPVIGNQLGKDIKVESDGSININKIYLEDGKYVTTSGVSGEELSFDHIIEAVFRSRLFDNFSITKTISTPQLSLLYKRIEPGFTPMINGTLYEAIVSQESLIQQKVVNITDKIKNSDEVDYWTSENINGKHTQLGYLNLTDLNKLAISVVTEAEAIDTPLYRKYSKYWTRVIIDSSDTAQLLTIPFIIVTFLMIALAISFWFFETK